MGGGLALESYETSLIQFYKVKLRQNVDKSAEIGNCMSYI